MNLSLITGESLDQSPSLCWIRKGIKKGQPKVSCHHRKEGRQPFLP